VTALLVKAEPYFVSSRAIFTGVDHSDPHATPVGVFHDPNNHATAVASILQKYANDANFKPKEHGYLETYDQHYTFINRTQHDDIFESQPLDDPSPLISLDDSLERFKHLVNVTYVPVSGTAQDAANAYAELIPKYVHPTMWSKTVVLVLIVIHCGDNNEITVGLSNIDMNLDVRAGGKIFIAGQRTSTEQQIFKVSSMKLTARAAFYANVYPIVNMNTLVSDFTTFIN